MAVYHCIIMEVTSMVYAYTQTTKHYAALIQVKQMLTK